MNQSSKESNQNKGAQSIPAEPANTQPSERKKGTGVAASPFNGVKLDLGFILLGAVALLLTEVVLAWPGSWGLAAYSLLCAMWLVWRTRKVARQQKGDKG